MECGFSPSKKKPYEIVKLGSSFQAPRLRISSLLVKFVAHIASEVYDALDIKDEEGCNDTLEVGAMLDTIV